MLPLSLGGLEMLDTIIFRYSPLSTLIAILCASVLVWAFLGREERALNGRSAPNELLTAKADHGSILSENCSSGAFAIFSYGLIIQRGTAGLAARQSAERYNVSTC